MTIAFVHNNRAFLPEIDAYTRFFTSFNVECLVVSPDEIGLTHRNVEWRFMGTDFSKPKEGIIRIHEYGSSSVPPQHKWKNWFKRYFNSQPDFRIYLNEYVKNSYRFRDRIPYGYRDMGIAPEWLENTKTPTEKKYDFIYTGDLSPKRKPEKLLNCFTSGKLQHKTILLLGRDYERLAILYQANKNIIFDGPVEHAQVREYILQSSYGINYIPIEEPFTHQTSTKFLEFAACRIPIVSSKYPWVKKFQRENGGNYFFLDDELSNFSWENVHSFQFQSPQLERWSWEHQIRSSGVLEFLMSKYPSAINLVNHG
jgi:hypothetical protein